MEINNIEINVGDFLKIGKSRAREILHINDGYMVMLSGINKNSSKRFYGVKYLFISDSRRYYLRAANGNGQDTEIQETVINVIKG